MKTFVVTLIERTEIPVFAKNEQEAVAKARKICVFMDTSSFTYDADENEADVCELVGDDVEMHSMGAEHNELVYQEEKGTTHLK